MRSYLQSFIDRFEFPLDSKEYILFNYDQLIKECGISNLENIIFKYKSIDFNYQNLLKEFNELLSKSTVNKFTSNLIFVILLCQKLEELYKENGYSEELFYLTMLDIKYKLIECRLVKGIWGTFVAPWFDGFFYLNRFTFTRLQFEISDFNFEYFDGQDFYHLKTPSVNIHIPRTSARLDKELIDKSINEAYLFYKNRFNNKVIFRCNSWLLFPRNLDYISKDSNIRYFANLFKIINTHYFDNYSEVWRLFDCEFISCDKLPNDSSLRRGYIEMIKNNEKTGSSFGFFVKNN